MKVLVIGGSGYIGGELLFQLRETGFSDRHEIFATFRKAEHEEPLKKLKCVAIKLDTSDGDAMAEFVREQQLDGVIDLSTFNAPDKWIQVLQALGEGQGDRFFIGSSGAKMFSSMSGFDQSQVIYDDYAPIESKKDSAPVAAFSTEAHENYRNLFRKGTEVGVRIHLVVPPMVYGLSRSFGNPVSIQIVNMVRIAKATGRQWALPNSSPYAFSHVSDTASVYVALLSSEQPPSGFYFTENGSFAWDQLSDGLLRGLDLEPIVPPASATDLDTMAEALDVEPELGQLLISCGGKTNICGRRAKSLGWKAVYDLDHLYSTAPEQAILISRHLAHPKSAMKLMQEAETRSMQVNSRADP